MTGARSRRRRSIPPTAGLAAFAALVAVVVHRTVFPYLSPDHDEPMYLVQSEMMRAGRLTLPAGQYPDFRPWLSGVEHGHLILVFQPVWPAILTASRVLTGSFLPVLALQAIVLVLLLRAFAAEVTRDRSVATVAAAIAVASPFFWLRSGTFLAYLLSFGLELAVGTLFLRARRTGSGRQLLGAGALLGVLFVARPLDALVVGAMVGGWTVWDLRGQATVTVDRLRRLAIGGAPGALIAMAYNTVVTGWPFRFALHAAGGDNGFGFGARRIAAGTPTVHVGVADSFWALGHNLLVMVTWLAGGWLLLPFVVAGLWVLWRDRTAFGICVVVAVTFPLVNVLYWGNLVIARNRDYLGPHYYLPLLAPVSIAAATALVRIARRRPRIVAGSVAAFTVLTMVLVVPRIDANLALTRLQRLDHAALAASHVHRAIVVLPADVEGGWIGHPRPSLLNDPRLEQDVVFAVDRGVRSMALFDRYPRRSLWRMGWRAELEAHGVRAVTGLDRLQRLRAQQVRFDVALHNTTDQPVVAAYFTDGSRVSHVVVDDHSHRGARYRLRWVLDAAGPADVIAPAGTRTVTASFGGTPLGSGTLAVGVAFGQDDDLARGEHEELRYWYRSGRGTVDVVEPGEVWHQLPFGDRGWHRLPAPGITIDAAADPR